MHGRVIHQVIHLNSDNYISEFTPMEVIVILVLSCSGYHVSTGITTEIEHWLMTSQCSTEK